MISKELGINLTGNINSKVPLNGGKNKPFKEFSAEILLTCSAFALWLKLLTKLYRWNYAYNIMKNSQKE